MDDQINSVLAEEGTKKVLELLLAKLESKQQYLQEISAERVALIMAGSNIDLSWVASQESVDKVQEEVNEMKVIVREINNKIDKLLVNDNTPEEKDPVTEPEEPVTPVEPEPEPAEDDSIYSYQLFDGDVPNNDYITNQIITDAKIKEALNNISTPGNGTSPYIALYVTYEIYNTSNTIIHRYCENCTVNMNNKTIFTKLKGLTDYTITGSTRVVVTATSKKPEWVN